MLTIILQDWHVQMCVKVSSANKVIHNDQHYMHINMHVHTLQAQNTQTLWLTLINTHVNMHKCPHATQWIRPHAWLNQASLGTLLLSYCQNLFKYITKLNLNPVAIMLQLLEKDLLLFFFIWTFNHLRAFRAGANSELIRPLVPLQLKSSFKWTHKSFCVYVSAHGNASSQLLILWLNAEHPQGDGFGSLQNGKSIFAGRVIGG